MTGHGRLLVAQLGRRVGQVVGTLERVTRPPHHPLADLDEPLTESCEPSLSDDELVAVRQLIEERFGDPNACIGCGKSDCGEQCENAKYYREDSRILWGQAPPDRWGNRMGYSTNTSATVLPAGLTTSAGDASPAGGDATPDVTTAGPPNLTFPDPAEMSSWPDWLLMMHASNSLSWPKHEQLVNELRSRAHQLEDAQK